MLKFTLGDGIEKIPKISTLNQCKSSSDVTSYE